MCLSALESGWESCNKEYAIRITESMPGRTTIHSQPLIAVRDVRASSRWYQQLLGFDSLAEHRHRDVYDRMLCAGQLVLQLHA